MAEPKLYMRGSVWWAWILGERCSTGCKDRSAALLRARDLERSAVDPTYRAASAISLAEVILAFLQDRITRGRAAGTLHCYRVKVRHLARLLGQHTPLSQITAGAVDRYCATRLGEGASRNTVSKELTALRGALKIARRRGWTSTDPGAVLPVGWSAEYTPRRRSLGWDDAQQLLAELARRLPHRAAWVALALATGGRRSEVERIERRDIDLQRSQIRIRGTKTTASARVVPILDLTRPLVAAALAWGAHQGRLVPRWGSAVRDLALACHAVGLERVTPNDLRRSLATWLVASGVEASLVAQLLGHTDSRMVERVYGRLSPGQLGAALEARLGGTGPTVLNLYGTPSDPSDRGDARDASQTPFPAGKKVPRDGIEPPTRGFSIPRIAAKKPRKTG